MGMVERLKGRTPYSLAVAEQLQGKEWLNDGGGGGRERDSFLNIQKNKKPRMLGGFS